METAPHQDKIQGKTDMDYQKRRKIISIIFLAIFVVFIVVISIILGKNLIGRLSDPEGFRMWVEQHGFWGQLAMIGMVTIQVIVFIIPGEPMEIGAGYAFGGLEGTILCLIGDAIGASIIFTMTRFFGVKMVEAFISREKINSLKFVKDSKRLNLLIFILFFIPGSPKDALTYFIGLTEIKLSTFLLLTTFARIPSVITSTLGGSALGLQNYTFAIIVFCITAVVSLIGCLIYKKISSKHGKENSQDE